MKKTLLMLIGIIMLTISFNGTASSDQQLSQSHSILIQELNLSPIQISKIESLKERAEKNIYNIDVDSISAEFITKSFETGKWDEIGIKRELNNVGKVQAEARYYRLQYLFEASEVLTVEQKGKLIDILKKQELF
jgi:Spy/CpxP family protein refolding chaperone